MPVALNATINQVVTVFGEIAAAHSQINDFSAGQVEDVSAITHKFPFLWTDYLGTTYKGEFGTVKSYKFRICIVDLLKSDLSNQFSVKSDCDSIMQDVLLMLDNDYDLAVNYTQSGTINPNEEYLGDRAAGVYADIVIDIPFDRMGTCDVPYKQIN